MDLETALQTARDLMKPWTRWSKLTQPDTLTVSISRRHLLDAVRALIDARWGYLSAITGLHIQGLVNPTPEEKQWSRIASSESDQAHMHSLPPATGDSFLILYHFCEGGAVLTLRIHPPSLSDLSVPSICVLIPSATLYERELLEMFGIQVVDTPDTNRLLLPDDWPDGVYPLRKDFQGFGQHKDQPV